MPWSVGQLCYQSLHDRPIKTGRGDTDRLQMGLVAWTPTCPGLLHSYWLWVSSLSATDPNTELLAWYRGTDSSCRGNLTGWGPCHLGLAEFVLMDMDTCSWYGFVSPSLGASTVSATLEGSRWPLCGRLPVLSKAEVRRPLWGLFQ